MLACMCGPIVMCARVMVCCLWVRMHPAVASVSCMGMLKVSERNEC